MAIPRNFSELRLGYADAFIEGTRDPNLLLAGYYDIDGLVEEVKDGYKFLILGYKGSGKTAIGQHLELLAANDPSLSTNFVRLQDFSYSDFAKIVKWESEPQSKFPTAWSWLILLMLFQSFFEDNEAPSHSDPHFYETVRSLIDMGLLPSPNLTDLVRASSRSSFKIRLPPHLETPFEQNVQAQHLQLPFLVDKMKSIACSFTSPKRHLLIIDGLDDILLSEEVQYISLAALILEADRLNSMFSKAGAPAKIILLCRTDLYERLPGANNNKVRQDSAIDLDWYDDIREGYAHSTLAKLVNRKARVHHPEIDNIFEAFFPVSLDGNRIQGTKSETLHYLLDHTRYTPRDFIQLLTHIQYFTRDGEKLSEEQIFAGISRYSNKYFLPEIRNELEGYIPTPQIEAAITLLGSLRQRNFEFAQLEDKAREHNRFSRIDLTHLLQTLFECGAVGHRFAQQGAPTQYNFKYRNRNATPDFRAVFCLHKGLWKALNLV